MVALFKESPAISAPQRLLKSVGFWLKYGQPTMLTNSLISMTGHLTFSLDDQSGAKKLNLQLISAAQFPECKKTFDYDREKNKFHELP
jgi:hypothetical protein